MDLPFSAASSMDFTVFAESSTDFCSMSIYASMSPVVFNYDNVIRTYPPVEKIWLCDISNGVDEVVRDNISFREGTPRAAYLEWVFRKSRGLLYGEKYKEGLPSEEETQENSERQTERAGFFANLGSLEELKDFMLKMKRVLHFIIADTTTESISTSAEFLNLFFSEGFRLSILNAMNSQNWEKVESLVMPIAVAFSRRVAVYRAFVISAVLLLSYQYLIGLVDRVGAKIYSSGSLEFRSTYISIVLFQGAYVWIKFRDGAPPSEQKPSPGLHRRSKVNELGVKVYYGNYEPCFKPPGSENYISVGSYKEEHVVIRWKVSAQ